MYQQMLDSFLIDYAKFSELRSRGFKGFAIGEHGVWKKTYKVRGEEVETARFKVATGVTIQIPMYAPIAVVLGILFISMIFIFSKAFYVFGFTPQSFAISLTLTYLYFSLAYRVYRNKEGFLLTVVISYIMLIAFMFSIIKV